MKWTLESVFDREYLIHLGAGVNFYTIKQLEDYFEGIRGCKW